MVNKEQNHITLPFIITKRSGILEGTQKSTKEGWLRLSHNVRIAVKTRTKGNACI